MVFLHSPGLISQVFNTYNYIVDNPARLDLNEIELKLAELTSKLFKTDSFEKN